MECPYVLLFSPSAFENFIEIYGMPPGARLVTVGPTTSAAVRAAGYEVYKEASPHTAAGMLEVLP